MQGKNVLLSIKPFDPFAVNIYEIRKYPVIVILFKTRFFTMMMQWMRLLTGVSVISILIISGVFAAETEEQGQRPRGSRWNEGVVEGSLLDDEHNGPLMYASVVLHTVTDSAMVTGAVSGEDGRFVLEDVPAGTFYVQISYVGYPDQTVNDIEVTPADPVYDLGTIRVSPDRAVLSEVTVEATRELMEIGLDRRVFNVGQELTSVGGSALDIMDNIPSVAVDFDGNVSLRGSENVTILIDGRPSELMGLDGSEALEQFPSEMVERVEVITNPSARFDPDGTSGIINIVLKEQERKGYNGMVSLNASTGDRYTGSVNLNYQLDKVNFFGSYSGRFYNMIGDGSSFRTSFLSDTTHLDQRSDYENDMNMHNFRVGLDYSINDKNTITASFGSNTRDMLREHMNDYMNMTNDFDVMEAFIRQSESDREHGGYQINLNHEHEFDQQYQEWSTDFVYSVRSMDHFEQNIQEYMYPHNSEFFENTERSGNRTMIRMQTDYIHPLGEDRKLEVGAQGFWRKRDSEFAFFNSDDGESWVENDSLSNDFIHDEVRFSGYSTYSTMLGDYSLQAGLRFEYADNEIDQLTMDSTYTKDYFSVFPTMHLRRNFDDTQSMQVSYSRRISRPRGRQLNPFPRYNDPYNISSGNPRLDPEYTNSMEIGYTRFGEKTTINPSIFYRYTEGMISRFRSMDDSGVAHTTYENLNTGTSYGTELAITSRFFDVWRVNGTMSYYYRKVEGAGAQAELENESYAWSARMVNNFNFSGGWSAQLTGRYRSPTVMLQGEMKEMYWADAAVRKDVFGGRGTVTLRLSDIFNTRNFVMYNHGDNYTVDFERNRESRMIYLGFSYRINEYERQRRSRDADMEEDIDFDELGM